MFAAFLVLGCLLVFCVCGTNAGGLDDGCGFSDPHDDDADVVDDDDNEREGKSSSAAMDSGRDAAAAARATSAYDSGLGPTV